MQRSTSLDFVHTITGCPGLHLIYYKQAEKHGGAQLSLHVHKNGTRTQSVSKFFNHRFAL